MYWQTVQHLDIRISESSEKHQFSLKEFLYFYEGLNEDLRQGDEMNL